MIRRMLAALFAAARRAPLAVVVLPVLLDVMPFCGPHHPPPGNPAPPEVDDAGVARATFVELRYTSGRAGKPLSTMVVSASGAAAYLGRSAQLSAADYKAIAAEVTRPEVLQALALDRGPGCVPFGEDITEEACVTTREQGRRCAEIYLCNGPPYAALRDALGRAVRYFP